MTKPEIVRCSLVRASFERSDVTRIENFGKEYPDAPKRNPNEFVDGSIIERLKSERFVEGLKS